MTSKTTLGPLIYAILISKGELTVDEIQQELMKLGIKRKKQYLREAVERLARETPVCPAVVEIKEGSERKYRALKLEEIKRVEKTEMPASLSELWKLLGGKLRMAEDNIY
jgi:sugar-specific transcriptional regulator TrmB